MLRPAKYKKLLKRTFARNGLTRSLTRLAIRRTARELGLWDGRVEENLIVSLTSFPARIGMVHLVVQSLLNQSLQPRKVVLYLSRHEFPGNKVPPWLTRLENGRFEIRFVEENLRSYKKLLFALVDFPGAWIATFDDDRLYPAHTLARLWEAAAVEPANDHLHGGPPDGRSRWTFCEVQPMADSSSAGAHLLGASTRGVWDPLSTRVAQPGGRRPRPDPRTRSVER